MTMSYGTTIPGLKIDGKDAPFPVVNEREIRAAAGLMFLLGGMTFAYVFFTRDYLPIYVLIPLFWLDFFLKTVFQPKYSIFGWIASWMVRGQKPEYVGAIQKRFAWGIGLTLASVMLIFVVGLGVRGILPFSICSICLFFMWMESALGICVGCKIYAQLLKWKILKEPAVRPTCPGGACSITRPPQ